MEEKDRNILIGCLIVTVLIIIMFILTVCCTVNSSYYEYIDYQGNKGTASYCGTNKGHLVCTKGNSTISVREYTKIEDK